MMLEMRLVHQDRRDIADLANRLPAIEIKLIDQTVSTNLTLSYATLPQVKYPS